MAKTMILVSFHLNSIIVGRYCETMSQQVTPAVCNSEQLFVFCEGLGKPIFSSFNKRNFR